MTAVLRREDIIKSLKVLVCSLGRFEVFPVFFRDNLEEHLFIVLLIDRDLLSDLCRQDWQLLPLCFLEADDVVGVAGVARTKRQP